MTMAKERRYLLSRPGDAVAELLRGSPALPSQVAAVGAFLALGTAEGGYYPKAWYAAGVFLTALLLLTALTAERPRPGRLVAAAVLLFAAYAVWCHLSILWSESDGLALEGAGRALVYLVVVALFALWRVDAAGARVLLALLGLGIATIGVVELLRVNASPEPLGYFDDIRFSEPLGYMNGNVAMWAIGMLACLATAVAREVTPALRALALGGAAVLGPLSLMGQSRGWALALPLALVCFVALGPGRPRKLLAVLAAAACTALAAGAALALHDQFDPASFDAELSDAVRATLLAGLVGTLLGLAGSLADRRLAPRPGPPLRTRRLVAAGLATAAVLVAAALLVTADLGGRIGDAWDSFKQGEAHAPKGTSRFSTAGTNRYDVWKVAWEVAKEHPVAGVGADAFQPEYLRLGTSTEEPRFAHSLELGVLAQTGVVGAALLFGALACLFWQALGAIRRAPPPAQAAAGAAVTIFVYWFLHGSVDWFWELPALAGPALAMLALAGALGSARPAVQTGSLSGRTRIAVGAVAVLAALSLALPALAERNISRATKAWRTDRAAAYDLLDQAAALNPLAARANLTGGTIALRTGDLGRAEREFEEARSREPYDNYAWLELGLIASARGDRDRAVAYLERAAALTPRDRIVRGALGATRRGRRLDPATVNGRLLDRARLRQSDAP
jgi:O-antigen ligase